MRLSKSEITRYVDGDWIIDIVEDSTTYEAWLSKRGYGVSKFMIGITKWEDTLDDFLQMVEDNLPDYQDIYDEEVCDE